MTAETETPAPPEAWADLIEGIKLLAQHPSSDISPFHCEHDTLWIMADDAAFTEQEIARLGELGFHQDGDGGFSSFRFGSA